MCVGAGGMLGKPVCAGTMPGVCLGCLVCAGRCPVCDWGAQCVFGVPGVCLGYPVCVWGARCVFGVPSVCRPMPGVCLGCPVCAGPCPVRGASRARPQELVCLRGDAPRELRGGGRRGELREAGLPALRLGAAAVPPRPGVSGNGAGGPGGLWGALGGLRVGAAGSDRGPAAPRCRLRCLSVPGSCLLFARAAASGGAGGDRPPSPQARGSPARPRCGAVGLAEGDAAPGGGRARAAPPAPGG